MKNHGIIVLFILCAALFLQSIGYAADFPDVEEGHKNREAISFLADKRVITGYEDGSFKPGNTVTRAELCVLISRAEGYLKNSGKFSENLPFSDVSEEYWAYDYIRYAHGKKIINGMGDGTFLPAGKVTYEQAVKMIVCSAGLENEAKNIGGAKWYTGYLEAAHRNGFLENVRVAVSESAKRADIAQLIYNAYKKKFFPKIDEIVSDINSGDFPGDEDKQPEKEKIIIKKIVVDPGHNYEGYDKGARNPDETIIEELITWRISNKLKGYLENSGFEVIMTRPEETSSIASDSVTDSLKARCDVANNSEADLFISVHCNTGGGTGTEVYCFSRNTEGEVLAELIEKAITSQTGLYSRGVKTAGFYVIKNTVMPSVLIETGFLDNEKDAAFLNSEEGQDKIAKAIAGAVMEYKAAAESK